MSHTICYLVEPHASSHEISAYIYIYIYIDWLGVWIKTLETLIFSLHVIIIFSILAKFQED